MSDGPSPGPEERSHRTALSTLLDVAGRWWPLVAACALFLGIVVAVGAADPLRPPAIGSDRLGPEPGEPLAHYAARARASLQVPGQTPRWALASFAAPETPDTASAALARAGGPTAIRVSEIVFHVSVQGVQTPITTVQVARSDRLADQFRTAERIAAAHLANGFDGGAGGTAKGRVIASLRAQCACVAGAVVRAAPASLRALAQGPGVLAVEALPPDSVFGRFAVVPVLTPPASG